jgi:hypothetical protein
MVHPASQLYIKKDGAWISARVVGEHEQYALKNLVPAWPKFAEAIPGTMICNPGTLAGNPYLPIHSLARILR